jgi:hypothetical protein
LYGSLKALDPVTGETKAQTRLEYPNFSGGALATAGNLVFLGQADGWNVNTISQPLIQVAELGHLPTFLAGGWT